MVEVGQPRAAKASFGRVGRLATTGTASNPFGHLFSSGDCRALHARP